MKIIIHEKYLDIVSEKFPDIEFCTEIDECPEAEALIGEAKDFVPEKLDKLPKLRWLQSFWAGYNTLDLEYIRKRNITLCNAKDIYSVPIAEDVICKILMHNTNAFAYLKSQKDHKWDLSQRRRNLQGQTVGLIGTGSIATEIAKRLQGFGVKIIGYKRNPVSTLPYYDEIHSGKRGLDYVMSNSDYIVVTADLNKETYHMINKANLKLMKETASIINIARGSIINQNDLTEALKNKTISYAGLDVFEVEPLPEEDELWDLENVYITPHASGTVKENKKRLADLIIANIQRFIDNEKLANVVI
ncbi:MAG: D-2-hydroxyacid dehydrogenase [Bacillota bacterium]|jgi:D-2-hydroxyacid dehydrogenase (NADP+)|nr:D-2-hydroxyacid dehydrogenase [Bacillota bacterium]NLL60244.1 D-2-hydroxyacid dehydrogenase [Tissierellia bacterium]